MPASFLCPGWRRPLAGAALCALSALAGCNTQQIRASSANQHLQRGGQALQRHDLDAALREFSEAVRLNPQLAPAHAGMGDVHQKQGDYSAAADSYSEAVRLDPFDFNSSLNLGRVYRLLADKTTDSVKKLEAAVRAFLHACDLRPDNYDARIGLAESYHQLGMLDLAADSYQKAIRLDATKTSAHINLGAIYTSQAKYYEAIRAYRNALEIDTNQAMVHVNLGTIYIRQERLAAASNSFELAIRLDPRLAVAHERLAECRRRQGRLDEALEGFTRALALDGRSADAYCGRGSTEMTLFLKDSKRGDMRDRAIEDWHRSLELEPDQPRLRTLVARYTPRGTRNEELVGPISTPD